VLRQPYGAAPPPPVLPPQETPAGLWAQQARDSEGASFCLVSDKAWVGENMKSAHPGECRDPDRRSAAFDVVQRMGISPTHRRFVICIPAFAGMSGDFVLAGWFLTTPARSPQQNAPRSMGSRGAEDLQLDRTA
jgi:hypothetical protein